MKHELRSRRLVLLLALLSAFPPLSIDMYLSAIPILVQRWHQPLPIVNLTLIGFFIAYCFSLLIYGPVSDRLGRRPPLMAGIGIFVAASLLCAISDNIIILIIFRILQACGAASASTLALAICKDVYRQHERERILAYISIIMALAPMLAPVFGGWILTWFSWRWIFVAQAAIASAAWAGVWFIPETLETPTPVTPLQTAGIYLQVLSNRKFMGLAVMMSVAVFPHFAFIAASSDIYITRLGLSAQAFGYFFAMNALSFMIGSFVCSRLLLRVKSSDLMTFSFAGIFIGGIGMALRWLPGPWGLALPMSLISFSFGIGRPPSNNLVLEQADHAGTASSLLVFIYFMFGALAMWLISLDWTDKIRIIGILGTGAGGSVLLTWLILQKIILERHNLNLTGAG